MHGRAAASHSQKPGIFVHFALLNGPDEGTMTSMGPIGEHLLSRRLVAPLSQTTIMCSSVKTE